MPQKFGKVALPVVCATDLHSGLFLAYWFTFALHLNLLLSNNLNIFLVEQRTIEQTS